MEAFKTTQVGALFSEGELQTLRRLLARLDTPSTTASTTFFAHKEIHANASTSTASLPWIIDSGATDHMTSCSSFFLFLLYLLLFYRLFINKKSVEDIVNQLIFVYHASTNIKTTFLIKLSL